MSFLIERRSHLYSFLVKWWSVPSVEASRGRWGWGKDIHASQRIYCYRNEPRKNYQYPNLMRKNQHLLFFFFLTFPQAGITLARALGSVPVCSNVKPYVVRQGQNVRSEGQDSLHYNKHDEISFSIFSFRSLWCICSGLSSDFEPESNMDSVPFTIQYLKKSLGISSMSSSEQRQI